MTEQPHRSTTTQVETATQRLLEHLRRIAPDLQRQSGEVVRVDLDTVRSRYARVFRSHDVAAVTDLVIKAHHFDLRLEVALIEPFLNGRSEEAATSRLEAIGRWLKRVNAQNHDGVILTPRLVDHLAGPRDIEELLDELERLRSETRRGRFRVDDPLQRDLELMRFSTEIQWERGNAGGVAEDYPKFKELTSLPPPSEQPYTLDDKHLPQVKRVAHEAAGFLRFLRTFRARTTRPIVVVGNDRYGRQWVVEPLEEYLEGDFTLRYDRAPSHKSMRLKLPGELPGLVRLGFPRQFVLQLSRDAPHVVIVDSCHDGGDRTIMQISRGARDYVNWFMAFNDVRSEGDGTQYESESSLPADHHWELHKWHQYVKTRRQLSSWVTPGPTYAVGHWAPILRSHVRLGDFIVARRDPELGANRPQVVVANPAVYPSEDDAVPDIFRETEPYYFDGPEKHEQATVQYGFGTHGFETRLIGTTTDTFVAEVQRQMKLEIARLINDEQHGGTTNLH